MSQSTLLRTPPILQKLILQEITVENFRPYGQLITPSPHGKRCDRTDAQLDLSQGIPRFYIMQLEGRGRQFHQITYHGKCTQCLGSLGGKDWFMVVAPANFLDKPGLHCLKAFRIPGDCFIKLEVGTWHAGPHFDHETVNFYNLELSDTNIVDHHTYNFLSQDQLIFEITNS